MEAFIKLAEELADIAGDIAREAFARTRNTMLKADQTVVTDTDRAIESALAEKIRAYFPEHGIFGEEHGRINPDARCQWVLDPIDGTSAFVAGIPTFTTLIALCDSGKPILGLIDQPILRERYSSYTSPSTKHRVPTTSLLATTSTDHFTPQQAAAFERARKNFTSTIRHGDAYLYAKLASGHIDAVIDAGLKPYDFCALVPVVEAAGGIITDWAGNPLTLASNGDVLACANRELHAQIRNVLHD